MLIIADKRLPAKVIQSLSKQGELLLLAASGIAYEAVSGHPDIFFCKVNDVLCVSPNLNIEIYQALDIAGIAYVKGEKGTTNIYPGTAAYNLAISGNTAIHNFEHTDSVLLSMLDGFNKIQVKQGYCRCNIVPLDDYGIITTDAGIHSAAIASGLNSMLVTPECILLPGFNYGFIGGCCGVHEKSVYITGSLRHHPQGNEMSEFMLRGGFSVTELYDGPLVDGGSLIFLP
ncbi:MAG: DUF6873 family GME fold protein [Bacteroidota bacterium]